MSRRTLLSCQRLEGRARTDRPLIGVREGHIWVRSGRSWRDPRSFSAARVARGAEQSDVRLDVPEVRRAVVSEIWVKPVKLKRLLRKLLSAVLALRAGLLHHSLLQRSLLDHITLGPVHRPRAKLLPAPPV